METIIFHNWCHTKRSFDRTVANILKPVLWWLGLCGGSWLKANYTHSWYTVGFCFKTFSMMSMPIFRITHFFKNHLMKMTFYLVCWNVKEHWWLMNYFNLVISVDPDLSSHQELHQVRYTEVICRYWWFGRELGVPVLQLQGNCKHYEGTFMKMDPKKFR